ncbi:hypothetical protein EJB05_32061, partial [Eragrostis curvula]
MLAACVVGGGGWEWDGVRLIRAPVGHPRVKNDTRTRTREVSGRVRVTSAGGKLHPHPHPTGAGPVGCPHPRDKSKALEEKLVLKGKEAELLQQQMSTFKDEESRLKVEKEDAVEEGYAQCISGSAYTIALFHHRHPSLDLSLLDVGFKCEATQRDALMNQAHDAAEAFVTSLKLIPEAAPAEEEESAEDEGPGNDQE